MATPQRDTFNKGIIRKNLSHEPLAFGMGHPWGRDSSSNEIPGI